MRRTVFLIAILASVLSCKTDNNKNKDTNESINSTEQISKNTFEESLLDIREISQKFNDQYKVEKFGIQKKGDSLISFVFKLNESTTKETVEIYSLGIRAFDITLAKPLSMSFNPTLKIIDGNKYVIVTRVINKNKYFDSLNVYIYKRKDWKGSGSLGNFKIRDILFEDKK